MQDESTPRQRLSPSLWHQWHPPLDQIPAEPEADVEEDDDDEHELHDQDDGCDNDDGNDEDSNNDVSRRGINIVHKSEKPQNDNSDRFGFKIAQGTGNESPNYIIKRFLPGATALAASPALHFAKNMEKKVCSNCSCPEACDTAMARWSSAESPKGFDLEILFPWRMKQNFML
ncbi:hypothetical protein L6164_000093 [Bauhinia variegata]|uniref:Uncharacterized protein n=1 Tax=Bauhinia variegata TaxID=167791 RepID=A0ACB9Q632_BAUVA|nr:hypothetical protein L6164_000093 [Bauhinia variegata]